MVFLFLISLFGVIFTSPVVVFSPLAVIVILAFLYNLKWPFYLLFFFIPLSWEQELSMGLGTDLPTEPLMVFLMGATFLLVLKNMKRLNAQIFLHPISLLLLAHYGWTWATSIFSEHLLVSVKFSLAKTWYITVFFLLSIIILREAERIRTLFKLVLIPLIVVTLIILFRHSQEGFSFESANFVMAPFFRNHVNSAALMSVMVPIAGYMVLTTKNVLLRYGFVFGLIILLLGAYFSYTRAAHISIILSVFVIPIVKWRLIRPILVIVMIAVVIFVGGLLENNNYLSYAPDYETTVSHSSFEDLVSATYEGKDISTMERLYRWVAGYGMVVERPWMGFGPGSFYNTYKTYTVTIFQTYVSDNPEKSGVHCYYLMILTEQGFIGLFIFIVLIGFALVYLESLYHRLKDRNDRWILMTTIMVFVVILLFQLINDMIETDKMGPFFFLCLAMGVILDLKNRNEPIYKNHSDGVV